MTGFVSRSDLHHSSPFVNGLALAAIGNIGSAEMIQDLYRDVEQHIQSGSPYTRKKAALACIRMFNKAPELIPAFVPRVVMLLTDRNHAVLLTGITLMQRMLRMQPDLVSRFRRLVPALSKILRKLVSAPHARDYSIGNVVDPFLQASSLALLQQLGHRDVVSSEAMNDILAQLATVTDTSKNAGHAIVYECVRTIMTIESESDLRMLAVNILGRFLIHRDNNIRYVALQTLCDVVDTDLDAVRRHRDTIVECLRDPDVSIRRRALELVYSLVDETSVEALAGEMISYLVICSNDEKPELCTKIAGVALTYAPARRWEIDALCMMVAIAGDSVKPQIISRLLYLMADVRVDPLSVDAVPCFLSLCLALAWGSFDSFHIDCSRRSCT